MIAGAVGVGGGYARRRTFMSIVAGIVAGVLGLTNLAGFGSYAAMMALVSGSLFVKCKAKPTTFFMRSSQITYEGVTAEAMTFVLFWTCVVPNTITPSVPSSVCVRVLPPGWKSSRKQQRAGLDMAAGSRAPDGRYG